MESYLAQNLKQNSSESTLEKGGLFLKNILNSNLQNVNFFISQLEDKKKSMFEDSNFLSEKLKESELNVKSICDNGKKYYEEMKERMVELFKKNEKNNLNLDQVEICKIIDETSNFSKFTEYTKSAEEEMKKLQQLKELINKTDLSNRNKLKKENFVYEDFIKSEEKNSKYNLTKRKRLRSSDGESTNNPEEIDKDYSNVNLHENQNQNNKNPAKESTVSETKGKKYSKSLMKREIIGLGLGKNDDKNKSKNTQNISLANKSNTLNSTTNTNTISNNSSSLNAKSTHDDNNKDCKEIKEKNNKSNTKINNISSMKSKSKPPLKKGNVKETKKREDSTSHPKKVYKNDESAILSESSSSEESFKVEEEKIKRISNQKKKSNKTYNKLVKITKYQNQLENNICTNTNAQDSDQEAFPTQIVSRNGPCIDEDEDEKDTKNIVLDRNEKISDVVLKLTDNLTDLCDSIGRESNTINDYLMSNLENCLFTKRLYYSEFDLTSKQKKFNYEYLTKDNNLIEKIENFQNVKLVIVRKGKQNINNLLKSMENFFKIYIKRKDMDGSAMIKGVLNCSFDKLQKYYNMHMRSFDYCEAIQIEVFLYKWDLFIDYNENYDKTNMTKKELAEMLSYGEKLQQTRVFMKKRNLLMNFANKN